MKTILLASLFLCGCPDGDRVLIEALDGGGTEEIGTGSSPMDECTRMCSTVCPIACEGAGGVDWCALLADPNYCYCHCKNVSP